MLPARTPVELVCWLSRQGPAGQQAARVREAFANHGHWCCSSLLRLDYTSLTTPGTVIDYNMRTHNRWASA